MKLSNTCKCLLLYWNAEAPRIWSQWWPIPTKISQNMYVYFVNAHKGPFKLPGLHMVSNLYFRYLSYNRLEVLPADLFRKNTQLLQLWVTPYESDWTLSCMLQSSVGVVLTFKHVVQGFVQQHSHFYWSVLLHYQQAPLRTVRVMFAQIPKYVHAWVQLFLL